MRSLTPPQYDGGDKNFVSAAQGQARSNTAGFVPKYIKMEVVWRPLTSRDFLVHYQRSSGETMEICCHVHLEITNLNISAKTIGCMCDDIQLHPYSLSRDDVLVNNLRTLHLFIWPTLVQSNTYRQQCSLEPYQCLFIFLCFAPLFIHRVYITADH